MLHVFILGQLLVCALTTVPGECDPSDPGAHSCDAKGQKALLQKHGLKPHTIAVEEEEMSPAAAWFAGAYGDCLEGCGPTKFRTVKCLSVFDGLELSNETCKGEWPGNATDCVCGAEVCQHAPASGCPAGLPSKAVVAGKTEISYDKVGCFALPKHGEKKMGGGPLDNSCLGWSKPEPCSGGLPFYRFEEASMSAETCASLCIGKAMDVFGIEEGRVCRCGASVLNREIWHEETPKPGLLFRPEALTPAADCPLEVFRYIGHYENDGIPEAYWDVLEGEVEYTDSIVAGKHIGELEEEDSIPEDEMVKGTSLKQESSRSYPSWQRNCWPSNCGPGRGPWKRRETSPVPGMSSRWNEYVRIMYGFTDDIDDNRKQVFREAVKIWADHTCISLQEQQPPPSELGITVGIWNKKGCYLNGMGNGRSKINLGWCNSAYHLGNMVHEIGHAIGMNHEQKRPDATTNYHGKGPFLKMHWDQITDRWLPQFRGSEYSYTGSANDGPGDPKSGWSDYDFASIMHYGSSGEFDTIPASSKHLVGNRKALSPGDIQQINDMYQCRSGPTPAPTPAPPVAPVDCSFESISKPYCGMWQDAADDDLDWTLRSGSTPSRNTGPDSAADGSHYLYLEASGRNDYDEAILRAAAPLQISKDTSMLVFKYHMKGYWMGKLRVKAGTRELWSTSGPQGSEWLEARVRLDSYVGSAVKISFVGRRGAGWSSDIAIDDVSFQPSPPTPAPTPSPTPAPTPSPTPAPTPSPTSAPTPSPGQLPTGVCGFEHDSGGDSLYCDTWSNAEGDDFDWSEGSRTPSRYTGPSQAFEGRKFLYMEASWRRVGESIILKSRPLTIGASTKLTFAYSMHGSNIGKLEVRAGSDVLWQKERDQGWQWNTAAVDLSAYAGSTVELSFVAFRGRGYRGDIAIDAIAFE